MTNLSQFDEQTIISDFFGDFRGHFLDIGCSGGVALSNTFFLGQLGWRGLLVEASPAHFQNLLANYTNRGYIEMVNAALWNERRLMKFHLSNHAFNSSLIEKDEANLYSSHYWVQTVTAEDLKAIQPECDFLSLDIEGADLIVFPQLFNAYPKCRLWTVEHANDNLIKNRWAELFEKYGLEVIATTPENFLAKKL